MQRENILNLLTDYNPADQDEIKFKSAMLDFINNNEIISGKQNKSGHLTGSAFITNDDFSEILLLHHAKLDKWLQPGGHSEIGELLSDTAIREAVEETCLSHFRFGQEGIFDVDIHPFPARNGEPEHFHYDIRFLLIADRNQNLQFNSESRNLCWVKLDEIHNYTTSRSILRMVSKLKTIAEISNQDQ